MEYQLADLFEILCDGNPDAEALIAGGKSYSRSDLDTRANQLAHYLSSQGIKAGDHVGVYAYNRVEWVEILLACWKISAVAININFRYTLHEARYIWGNSNMVALVYERGFTPIVNELAKDHPEIKHYIELEDDSSINNNELESSVVNYETALQNQSTQRNFLSQSAPRSADDIYFMYTGGTTGMPKGVLWRHEDFYFNVITSINEPITTPEGILHYNDNPNGLRNVILSPLMHGGGQYAVLIAIFSGGCAAIPTSKSLNTDEVLGLIEEHKMTMLTIIGDAMARPLAEAKLASSRDTSSLAILISGGAILTQDGRAMLLKAFGEHLYITGGIGGSEIGTAAVESGNHDTTAGPRFQPNKNMAVLDEDLNPLLPGSNAVGFMAVTGHIPLGYYNDAEKTADTFKIDKNGQRWVVAGDFAKIEDDGSFSLVGRGSQCINSGGEKIFVEEVERAVAMHPSVRFCAVVGIPDPKWQQKVAVVVELEEGADEPTLAEIQETCRELIAGYKVPRQITFAKFSLTPNGKIDYKWAKAVAEEALGIKDSLGIKD